MPVWSDKKTCTVAHMLEQMRKKLEGRGSRAKRWEEQRISRGEKRGAVQLEHYMLTYENPVVTCCFVGMRRQKKTKGQQPNLYSRRNRTYMCLSLVVRLPLAIEALNTSSQYL